LYLVFIYIFFARNLLILPEVLWEGAYIKLRFLCFYSLTCCVVFLSYWESRLTLPTFTLLLDIMKNKNTLSFCRRTIGSNKSNKTAMEFIIISINFFELIIL
jgi:hypothetical protein